MRCECNSECCGVSLFVCTLSVVIVLAGGGAVEAVTRESSTPNFELVIAYGFAVLACIAFLTLVCGCACVKIGVGVVKVHASIPNSGKYTKVRPPRPPPGRQFRQAPAFPPAARLAAVTIL